MNIVFVEPAFPPTQRHFVRALAEVGATVIGIGERPGDHLDDELKGWMHALPPGVHGGRRRHPHRRGAVGAGQGVGRPAGVHDRGPHHGRRAGPGGVHDPRHVGAHGLALPRQAVDEGGAARGRVPTAASTAADTADDVHAFAADSRLPADPQAAHRRGRVGHRAGGRRGPSSTRRWRRFGGKGVESIAVEEFVEGTRASTTPSPIDGHAALDFVSHYYPNVLEAMRTRWISPQFISTNRIDSAGDYQELREMGARVNAALGHRHQRHAHGVVLRPEGAEVLRDRLPATRVGAWDLYSARQRPRPLPRWAKAIVHGHVGARPRGSSPPGSSRCGPTATATSAATPASTRRRPACGEWVIDAHLPDPGTPTQPVEAGYWANAYVRMRHPDYDALRG